MLQYQNGGLLNVFLKPVPSSGSQNGTAFDIQNDASVMTTSLMHMVMGKLEKADLAVLAAIPEDLGGGEAAVKEAIANPNHEGQVIVAFIVCLVFATLGLLAIFVCSLICCCCCPSGGHSDSDEEDEDEQSSKSTTKDQNVICCSLHLLAFVMTALLLLGLAVSIGYYFGAANVLSETLADSQADDKDVIVWLEGNSSSFSIGRILQFLVSHVGQFGNSSIESAKTSVNSTVTILKEHLLNKTLPDEISTLLTAVMTEFKVMEIWQAVDEMVYAVGNATENSNYITTNYNSTIITIIKNSSKLDFILNSTVLNCSADKSQTEALKIHLNPRDVLPVPPDVALMLNKTNNQLQDLKSKLENVTKQLQAKKDDVMKELQDKLDFDKILEGMNDLMGNLEDQFASVNDQLDGVTAKVSSLLGQYSGPAKAALYVLCLPCLLAGILFLIFLILFLFEALQRHLFSLTGESASEASGTGISRSRVCGGGMFCICSALLLLPIILFGLVAVLMVTMGGFLDAELCPYIANNSGIRKTDYVINSQVQVMWDDLIPSQAAGGSAATGNDLTGLLNLKAPQNLLHAVEVGCDPQTAGPSSKSGLLVQTGIDNLVNVTALLESPLLTDGIKSAQTSLVDGIAGAKLGDVVPNSTIADIKNFTSVFQKAIAFLNISNSAKHLQKNVFETEAIKAFAEKMNSNCTDLANNLTVLVPELEASNAFSDELRNAYDGLNNNTLALNSSKLEAGIASFKSLTATNDSVAGAIKKPLDTFVAALLGSINGTGNAAFANLTRRLLPCGSLHYAVKSVVFMGCGPSGLASRLFAWGLFLSLCLFFTFFSLLSLCLLWRVQNHQAKRFGDSGSPKEDDSASEY
ncbi:hypothetical protein AAHC03_022725 [Spirometra sp. Aus1]